MTTDTALLPRANGPALGSAAIRTHPADFQVDETLSFEPSGTGDHQFVRIEKCGVDTHRAAEALARFAGVSPRNVGYAGRKDRHAITRQWLSFGPLSASEPDWASFRDDQVRVLDVTRNERKLKRGAIKCNLFRIVLRDVDDSKAAELRLERLGIAGVPNYFGPQRFGHGGRNLERALAVFAGARLSRNVRSMALSAARSLIFNAVLASRVENGTWNRLLPGDLANLDGSRSVFPVTTVDDVLEGRLSEMDIHPSGPLWGCESMSTEGDVRALEASIAARFKDYADGLVSMGMKSARRALRLTVRDLEWECGAGTLALTFRLVAGSYATVVLREIFELNDIASPSDSRNAGND